MNLLEVKMMKVEIGRITKYLYKYINLTNLN